MISKEQRCELADILAKDPVDGISPISNEDCVIFKVEEIQWVFKISRYGTVHMKILSNGNIVKESLYGLYPLSKEPSKMIRQWRIYVTRQFGGNWNSSNNT